MTQSLPTAHVTVQMGLRASRVAYLVPGDEDWHSTARTALHQLTNLWAGAGFVVVPVTSRDVHHALIAALRAYDPDMVLIPAGNSPVPVTTSKHLARAQETISAACANYRRPGADDKQAVMAGFGEVADTYLSESGMIRMTPLDLIVDRAADSPVGAHPCLGGALGVAAAALWGLSEPPRNEVHPLRCGLQRSAVWRLIARTTTDAEDLHGVTTQNKHEGVYSTEFERTRFGLTDVFELGPDEQPPILIVWGDASDDFALAMAWDRTYRFGIWIPDEWWQDEVTHGSVVQAVITMAMRAGIAGRKFIHTSTSLPLSAVEERMNACKLETVELLDGEAFAVPNRLDV